MNGQNYDYFYHRNRGTIRFFPCKKRLENGRINPEWIGRIKNRAELLSDINTGWDFNPPRFGWNLEKFNDYSDWQRVLGSSKFAMLPEIGLIICYNDYIILDTVIRIRAAGRTLEECIEIYGRFLSSVMDSLPVPGRTDSGCSTPLKINQKTRIFWLGLILQCSRMCRK